MSVVTPESTVGSKKVWPSSERLPPVSTLAPLDSASFTWASTLSTAAGLISGPGRCRLDAVANLQRLHPRGELLDEGVMHALLDEDAVGAGRRSGPVPVLRDHGALDGRIDVGVVEDDEGRIATKLEADALHGGGGLRHQQIADRRRTGEADEAHRRVFAPGLADGRGVAVMC